MLMEWRLNQPVEYELEALGSFLAGHYVVRSADGEELHLVEDALVLAGWTPPGGTEDADLVAIDESTGLDWTQVLRIERGEFSGL